jgi:site-specific DNA recombinase
MGKKPRCTKPVAYIRTSTTEQEISPEAQLEKVRAYCTLRGLEVAEVICESVSAKKNAFYKRPEGRRIQALIEAGVRHIVALKLDRIFRDTEDALTTAKAWRDAGISLHLADLGDGRASTQAAVWARCSLPS